MKHFIHLPDVMRVTGLARSTVYDGIKAGWFPKPIPLGSKSVAWDSEEIAEWQERRIAARDGEAARC